MYSMQTQIGFADSGADGKLKLSSAMTMMMNCCQFQEYQEKNLFAYLQQHGIAIFLASIQMDIIRMPEFRENITAAVKIYDCRSIYGLRRITIRDGQGDLCVVANAAGAFFKIADRKAVKVVPEEFGVVFDAAETMECLPRKIPVPRDGGRKTFEFPVTPSRLDPNGHMTSAEYLGLAADRLPQDHTFNRVRIEYKHQVKLGEAVYPVIYGGNEPDSTIIVDMCNKDGVSCAVAEFSTADLFADMKG